jgi:predicted nucleotidyltransferase
MNQAKIENQIKQIVFKYFSPSEYEIFVFGSRAKGKSRRFSDWDIGIRGERPAPIRTVLRAEEELENSDIPVNVEIVDFNQTDQKFAKPALTKTIPWTTT